MKLTRSNLFWSAALAGVALAAALGSAAAAPGQLPVGITDQQIGLQYAAASGLGSGDVRITAANIVRVAMGLLGVIAVAVILFAGFTWMTAGGNEEKINDAKKWLWGGVIGLIIILGAYSLATFVANSLVAATGYSRVPF